MKDILHSLGYGVVIVVIALVLWSQIGARWALWLLWPGILFNRMTFKNYYAESHLIGWPTSLEVVCILGVSVIVYAVLVTPVIRHLQK